MQSFGRLLLAAVIAGCISGFVVSVVHQIATVPVILAAEVYENAGAEAAPADAAAAVTAPAEATATVASDGHDHEHDAEGWSPADGLERTLYTTAADVLTGIGFALVLMACYRLWGREMNWRTGFYWGLAGFGAVILAPTLGLPFEVPGAEAAPLFDRQLWWIGTVVATGAGLAMIFLGRTAAWCILGLALIVAPHAIGAPQPTEHASVAPESLAHQFIVAATVTGLLFWAALGATTGVFYKRLVQAGT